MAVNGSNWRRIIDLEAGVAMVVTDLHGDWDAYQRYRDRFLTLREQGTADYLILNGDMIHRSGPPETDNSIEIVLDILALREELGDRIIYLLGNHEIPHIYSILLQKGNDLFTPRFEFGMGEHRSKIVALFRSLPFYLRTPGGVAICHAGATNAIGEEDASSRLFNYSHQAVLEQARAQITAEKRPFLMREMRRVHSKTYNEMARTYFAVEGISDPRYDDFLTGTLASADPDFELLWSALFSRNEKEYGNHSYRIILANMLLALSEEFHSQRVMVTGHIDCRGGYKIIGSQQLRLASAKHAQPREAGLYLLFDVEKKVRTAEELLPQLHSVFTSNSP